MLNRAKPTLVESILEPAAIPEPSSTVNPGQAAENGTDRVGGQQHDKQHAAEREATAPVDDGVGAAAPKTCWFRRGDQLIVGGLVIAVVVLMAVHWARLSGFGLKPIEIERLPERQFDFQLEINGATWVEWMQLEGIGDTLARRIVEDREANGPFSDIDDLTRVKGIGPKTIERIRPWLRVDPPSE